jgi:putative ABC transport system permease protein
MKAALLYALRRLRRGWRSGELLILSLAIAIAVAASSAVSLFSARVGAAIEAQTGETLGADLLFSSRNPLPAEIAAAVQASGARATPVVQFPSVVFAGEHSALAGIKVVAEGFPLRGRLTVASEPFGPAEPAAGVPPPGEAWADQRLWQELRLGAAPVVRAGQVDLRVTRLIVDEPGRGAGFTDLAPRLMLNAADLAASGLMAEGARAQHWLLAAGSAEQLAPLHDLELPFGVRRVTPQDSRPELQSALKNAGEFLGLARIAASLLAAAAIALCAWQFGLRLRDEVALLKCLGARGGFIAGALLIELLLLGLAGAAVGAATGWLAQELITGLLAELLLIALPPAPLLPLLHAGGLTLLLLAAFALPPLWQARATPPIRVFQRSAQMPSLLLPLGTGGLGVLALLWWQATSLKSATFVLGGAVLLVGALALLALLLVRLLTPLRHAGGTALRFGLANIARRRGATLAQAVALGLALLALLLVTVVRQDLLATWQNRLPAETPNQFLINIQPEQVESVQAFFAARGYPDLPLWPMARARLAGLRGEPVHADSFTDPETQRWINREFNLSWTDTLGDDNEVVQGEWWGPEGRGQAWLSADKYAIERLGLKLGDRLTLDFAGQAIEFTVHNFREVDWDSFRPNFFLLAPPGVLDGIPAQRIASFYLPPERRALLRELVDQFPNITALDIEALMQQVRAIMDRIVAAVEFLFLFTLAAGLTVLLAAIESTRAERIRESALLRTLGARNATIRGGLIAEYAALGVLAGLTAAVAAQLLAWVLAEQVFRIPYGPRPLFWLSGALAGGALVTLLGWLSLRRTLSTPPRAVLSG